MVEVLKFLGIGLPDLLGEAVIGLFSRLVSGRWEPVYIGARHRAETAVRLLAHHRIGCWLRSSGQGTNEVMVRTKRTLEASRVLEAA